MQTAARFSVSMTTVFIQCWLTAMFVHSPLTWSAAYTASYSSLVLFVDTDEFFLSVDCLPVILDTKLAGDWSRWFSLSLTYNGSSRAHTVLPFATKQG